MASSSLDTASLYYLPSEPYELDISLIQRLISSNDLFYTVSTDTEYIIIGPVTGSNTHAGKPNIL